MLRALHELRDGELPEFRRRRGITVAGAPERGAVLTKVRELIEFARHHGYGHTEVSQMIESLPRNP